MTLRADPQALLRNALDAAACGWHVFPLRPGDKRPAFPDHDVDHCTGRDPRCAAAGEHVGWELRATVDPDRIRRAWSRVPYNIGIACGPSGLVVIDLDQPKPGTQPPPRWDLPGVRDGYDAFALVCERANQTMPIDTRTVATPSGGTHLYYRAAEDIRLGNTGGVRGSGLGWLIDTRGHGGYVVAAGSVVETRPYTTTHTVAPVPLPGWLAAALRPAPQPPRGPAVVSLATGRRAAFLDKAVRASLDAIRAAGDGTLNNTLWGAAVSLGQLVAGGALREHDTEELLLAAAVAAKHPAGQARRTIRSGFRRGAQRPRRIEGTTT